MPQDPLPRMPLDVYEQELAKQYNVPMELIQSLTQTESSGGTNIVGPVIKQGSQAGTRAHGKYQISEDLAKDYGIDRSDPYQNAYAGIRNLSEMYEHAKSMGVAKTERGLRGVSLLGYFGGKGSINKAASSGGLIQGHDGQMSKWDYVNTILDRAYPKAQGFTQQGQDQVEAPSRSAFFQGQAPQAPQQQPQQPQQRKIGPKAMARLQEQERRIHLNEVAGPPMSDTPAWAPKPPRVAMPSAQQQAPSPPPRPTTIWDTLKDAAKGGWATGEKGFAEAHRKITSITPDWALPLVSEKASWDQSPEQRRAAVAESIKQYKEQQGQIEQSMAERHQGSTLYDVTSGITSMASRMPIYAGIAAATGGTGLVPLALEAGANVLLHHMETDPEAWERDPTGTAIGYGTQLLMPGAGRFGAKQVAKLGGGVAKQTLGALGLGGGLQSVAGGIARAPALASGQLSPAEYARQTLLVDPLLGASQSLAFHAPQLAKGLMAPKPAAPPPGEAPATNFGDAMARIAQMRQQEQTPTTLGGGMSRIAQVREQSAQAAREADLMPGGLPGTGGVDPLEQLLQGARQQAGDWVGRAVQERTVGDTGLSRGQLEVEQAKVAQRITELQPYSQHDPAAATEVQNLTNQHSHISQLLQQERTVGHPPGQGETDSLTRVFDQTAERQQIEQGEQASWIDTLLGRQVQDEAVPPDDSSGGEPPPPPSPPPAPPPADQGGGGGLRIVRAEPTPAEVVTRRKGGRQPKAVEPVEPEVAPVVEDVTAQPPIAAVEEVPAAKAPTPAQVAKTRQAKDPLPADVPETREPDYGAGNKHFPDGAATDPYQKGGFHFEAGTRGIREWSRAMVNDFGDGIRPQLEGIYNRVRDFSMPGWNRGGSTRRQEVTSVTKKAQVAVPAPEAAPAPTAAEPAPPAPAAETPAEAVKTRRAGKAAKAAPSAALEEDVAELQSAGLVGEGLPVNDALIKQARGGNEEAQKTIAETRITSDDPDTPYSDEDIDARVTQYRTGAQARLPGIAAEAPVAKPAPVPEPEAQAAGIAAPVSNAQVAAAALMGKTAKTPKAPKVAPKTPAQTAEARQAEQPPEVRAAGDQAIIDAFTPREYGTPGALRTVLTIEEAKARRATGVKLERALSGLTEKQRAAVAKHGAKLTSKTVEGLRQALTPEEISDTLHIFDDGKVALRVGGQELLDQVRSYHGRPRAGTPSAAAAGVAAFKEARAKRKLEPLPDVETKVFSTDKAESYKEDIRNFFKESITKAHAGVDPAVMMKMFYVAGNAFERGARRFDVWASHMMEDLGTGIRPYLNQLYNNIRDTAFDFDKKGISSRKEQSAMYKALLAEETAPAETAPKAEPAKQPPGLGRLVEALTAPKDVATARKKEKVEDVKLQAEKEENQRKIDQNEEEIQVLRKSLEEEEGVKPPKATGKKTEPVKAAEARKAEAAPPPAKPAPKQAEPVPESETARKVVADALGKDFAGFTVLLDPDVQKALMPHAETITEPLTERVPWEAEPVGSERTAKGRTRMLYGPNQEIRDKGVKYLGEMKNALKEAMGLESGAKATPQQVLDWFNKNIAKESDAWMKLRRVFNGAGITWPESAVGGHFDGDLSKILDHPVKHLSIDEDLVRLLQKNEAPAYPVERKIQEIHKASGDQIQGDTNIDRFAEIYADTADRYLVEATLGATQKLEKPNAAVARIPKREVMNDAMAEYERRYGMPKETAAETAVPAATAKEEPKAEVPVPKTEAGKVTAKRKAAAAKEGQAGKAVPSPKITTAARPKTAKEAAVTRKAPAAEPVEKATREEYSSWPEVEPGVRQNPANPSQRYYEDVKLPLAPRAIKVSAARAVQDVASKYQEPDQIRTALSKYADLTTRAEKLNPSQVQAQLAAAKVLTDLGVSEADRNAVIKQWQKPDTFAASREAQAVDAEIAQEMDARTHQEDLIHEPHINQRYDVWEADQPFNPMATTQGFRSQQGHRVTTADTEATHQMLIRGDEGELTTDVQGKLEAMPGIVEERRARARLPWLSALRGGWRPGQGDIPRRYYEFVIEHDEQGRPIHTGKVVKRADIGYLEDQRKRLAQTRAFFPFIERAIQIQEAVRPGSTATLKKGAKVSDISLSHGEATRLIDSAIELANMQIDKWQGQIEDARRVGMPKAVEAVTHSLMDLQKALGKIEEPPAEGREGVIPTPLKNKGVIEREDQLDNVAIRKDVKEDAAQFKLDEIAKRERNKAARAEQAEKIRIYQEKQAEYRRDKAEWDAAVKRRIAEFKKPEGERQEIDVPDYPQTLAQRGIWKPPALEGLEELKGTRIRNGKILGWSQRDQRIMSAERDGYYVKQELRHEEQDKSWKDAPLPTEPKTPMQEQLAQAREDLIALGDMFRKEDPDFMKVYEEYEAGAQPVKKRPLTEQEKSVRRGRAAIVAEFVHEHPSSYEFFFKDFAEVPGGLTEKQLKLTEGMTPKQADEALKAELLKTGKRVKGMVGTERTPARAVYDRLKPLEDVGLTEYAAGTGRIGDVPIELAEDWDVFINKLASDKARARGVPLWEEKVDAAKTWFDRFRPENEKEVAARMREREVPKPSKAELMAAEEPASGVYSPANTAIRRRAAALRAEEGEKTTVPSDRAIWKGLKTLAGEEVRGKYSKKKAVTEEVAEEFEDIEDTEASLRMTPERANFARRAQEIIAEPEKVYDRAKWTRDIPRTKPATMEQAERLARFSENTDLLEGADVSVIQGNHAMTAVMDGVLDDLGHGRGVESVAIPRDMLPQIADELAKHGKNGAALADKFRELASREKLYGDKVIYHNTGKGLTNERIWNTSLRQIGGSFAEAATGSSAPLKGEWIRGNKNYEKVKAVMEQGEGRSLTDVEIERELPGYIATGQLGQSRKSDVSLAKQYMRALVREHGPEVLEKWASFGLPDDTLSSAIKGVKSEIKSRARQQEKEAALEASPPAPPPAGAGRGVVRLGGEGVPVEGGAGAGRGGGPVVQGERQAGQGYQRPIGPPKPIGMGPPVPPEIRGGYGPGRISLRGPGVERTAKVTRMPEPVAPGGATPAHQIVGMRVGPDGAPVYRRVDGSQFTIKDGAEVTIGKPAATRRPGPVKTTRAPRAVPSTPVTPVTRTATSGPARKGPSVPFTKKGPVTAKGPSVPFKVTTPTTPNPPAKQPVTLKEASFLAKLMSPHTFEAPGAAQASGIGPGGGVGQGQIMTGSKATARASAVNESMVLLSGKFLAQNMGSATTGLLDVPGAAAMSMMEGMTKRVFNSKNTRVNYYLNPIDFVRGWRYAGRQIKAAKAQKALFEGPGYQQSPTWNTKVEPGMPGEFQPVTSSPKGYQTLWGKPLEWVNARPDLKAYTATYYMNLKGAWKMMQAESQRLGFQITQEHIKSIHDYAHDTAIRNALRHTNAISQTLNKMKGLIDFSWVKNAAGESKTAQWPVKPSDFAAGGVFKFTQFAGASAMHILDKSPMGLITNTFPRLSRLRLAKANKEPAVIIDRLRRELHHSVAEAFTIPAMTMLPGILMGMSGLARSSRKEDEAEYIERQAGRLEYGTNLSAVRRKYMGEDPTWRAGDEWIKPQGLAVPGGLSYSLGIAVGEALAGHSDYNTGNPKALAAIYAAATSFSKEVLGERYGRELEREITGGHLDARTAYKVAIDIPVKGIMKRIALPSQLRSLAAKWDPVIRDYKAAVRKGGPPPQGLTERVVRTFKEGVAEIMGQYNVGDLQSRLNTWGEEMYREPGQEGIRKYLPWEESVAKDIAPIKKEAQRLNKLPGYVQLKEGETEEQLRQRNIKRGALLTSEGNELIASDAYKGADDEQKKWMLGVLFDKAGKQKETSPDQIDYAWQRHLRSIALKKARAEAAAISP